MDGRIATYGFSMDVISKNNQLQKQLSQIQGQIATGVKYSTLQGYGIDSLRLQNTRVNLSSVDGYLYNIDTATSKIKQITLSVKEVGEQAENVLGALSILPQEGDIDISNVKELAKNARDIIEEILNTKIGEDYIFSGSDVKNKPLEGTASLVNRVKTEMASFLDGTNNADALLSNVSNYTDSQAGFSLGVQNSTNVYARADDNLEVDYTVRANDDAFKTILTNLTVLSELEFPDDQTDLASEDDFYKILNTTYQQLQSGVEKVRNSEIKLANAELALGRKQESFVTEKGYLQTTIEDIQSIDPAEAIIQFQNLQTNLEAAFQATSLISSLSLARLL